MSPFCISIYAKFNGEKCSRLTDFAFNAIWHLFSIPDRSTPAMLQTSKPPVLVAQQCCFVPNGLDLHRICILKRKLNLFKVSIITVTSHRWEKNGCQLANDKSIQVGSDFISFIDYLYDEVKIISRENGVINNHDIISKSSL